MSINGYKNNPLNCVSLPGYTWQCGLKNTRNNLQTLQDKELILMLEKNIRGGISSVMGDRYVTSFENKMISYIDATNEYGIFLIEPLAHDEIEMWHGHLHRYMNKLEDVLNIPDDSDIGCFFKS